MKAQKDSNKNGGALLMAMLVMIVFSMLTIGLFKLFQTDAVETVYVEHHRRAFWMAEMGMEKVLDRLVLDEQFRKFYTDVPYTIAYGEGSFSNASYTIESITTLSVGDTGAIYTVTSRGTVGTMNRRIRQDILVRPGGPHALRATGGDIVIDSNVYIDGDIYVDTGDFIIEAKQNLNPNNLTGVDGYVVVSAGTIAGNGASSVDVIQVPSPPTPRIDEAFWQPFLNDVTNNANTNGFPSTVSSVYITTEVSNYNYSATSSTMTSGKDLIIDGTATGSEGFHYLVSATSIKFSQWPELKDQTVIIVDGNITFAQNVTFNNNCVVFATGNIDIAQSSDAGGIGATLIARGDITFAPYMVFHGIIFAEGTVNVGSNAEVKGTIIADSGINIGSNAEVTFDPDVFLNPLPGLKDVWSQANLMPGRWTEIAPAP